MTESTLPTAGTAPTAATSPASRGARRGDIAAWTAQIVLGLFMVLASGLPKLLAVEDAAVSFDRIGYGDWFMYLVGALEVAGGAALVIPALAGPAALALAALMVGAEVFTWVYLDTTYWYTPVILFLVFAALARHRRPSTAHLVRRVRSAAPARG